MKIEKVFIIVNLLRGKVPTSNYFLFLQHVTAGLLVSNLEILTIF